MPAKVIKPGTPEAAAFLGVGYQMSLEDARQVIADRDTDPQLVPWAEYQKAKAFLSAYEAKDPQVTSPRPGWKRRRNR